LNGKIGEKISIKKHAKAKKNSNKKKIRIKFDRKNPMRMKVENK
jgi:hypothetical protein